MVKMLMMRGVCLSRLFEIRLSLGKLVVFLDIVFLILVHVILDIIIHFFWCELCCSSYHSIASCPFYACYPKHDLSLHLAQCTWFEVGDRFRLVPKF